MILSVGGGVPNISILHLIISLNCIGSSRHDMPYGPVPSPRPTAAAIIHNGRHFG